MFDKTVCLETDAQIRNDIIYFPNETEPFSGNNLCEYENGQKKIKGEIKDGLIDGELSMWYENGQKKIETTFSNGKPFGGKVSSWDQNGQPQTNGEFYITISNLYKQYTYQFFNNNILAIFNYENNKFVSESLVGFHDNGLLTYEHIIIDGREFFKTRWYESGKKESESQFSYPSSFPEGIELYKSWFENGQKEYEGKWINDFDDCIGLHTSWYENGRTRSSTKCFNGGGEHVSTEWHENGQIKYKMEWHENGQMKSDKEYDKDGVCIKGDC